MTEPQTPNLPATTTGQAVQINFSVNSLEELREFSKILAQSGMVPKDYLGKPDAIMASIIFGKELGLAPLNALSNIANINGRPSIWGDSAKGLCLQSGQMAFFEEFYELDGNKIGTAAADEAIANNKNVVAVCVNERKGQVRQRTEYSWSMAKRAGLAGKDGPWKTNPTRQLQMRSRGFRLRDDYADVLKGLYLREELYGETIDVTPSGEGTYSPTPSTDDDKPEPEPGTSKLKSKMKMPKAAATVSATDPQAPLPDQTPQNVVREKKGDVSLSAALDEAFKMPKAEPDVTPAQPDPPPKVEHMRATIATAIPRNNNTWADLSLEKSGKSVDVVYVPNQDSIVQVPQLQEMIGSDVFFHWKETMKGKNKIFQIFDVIPAEDYAQCMMERDAKAANQPEQTGLPLT